MNPAQKDITVRLNSDFIWDLTLLNKDKTPMDLTGATAKMEIRDAPGGAIVHLEISTANGYIAGPLGVTGSLDIRVPEAIIKVMTWAEGTYDLLLTDASGSVIPLIEGSATTKIGTTVL